MNQATLTYVKLGIVAVAVVLLFVLAITGRISGSEAVQNVGIVVGALVAALGISGAGSAVGSAMRESTDRRLPPPPATPKT